jgi:hypothetical protein
MCLVAAVMPSLRAWQSPHSHGMLYSLSGSRGTANLSGKKEQEYVSIIIVIIIIVMGLTALQLPHSHGMLYSLSGSRGTANLSGKKKQKEYVSIIIVIIIIVMGLRALQSPHSHGMLWSFLFRARGLLCLFISTLLNMKVLTHTPRLGRLNFVVPAPSFTHFYHV